MDDIAQKTIGPEGLGVRGFDLMNTNAPETHDANDVEKAMGDLLDQVHDQTDFPVDVPGTKPSQSMTYNVAAQLSVQVHSKWKLFDGCELTDVSLSLAVSKSTQSRGASA